MTMGRRRTRSISTPACRLTSANGSVSSATSTPICIGVACSSTAAVSGSARFVICAPNDVIVSEPHSFMNSGWRQSPRKLRRKKSCMRDMVLPVHRQSRNAPQNGGENAWRQAGAAKVPESDSRLLPGRGLRPDDYRVTPRQIGSEAVRCAMRGSQCVGPVAACAHDRRARNGGRRRENVARVIHAGARKKAVEVDVVALAAILRGGGRFGKSAPECRRGLGDWVSQPRNVAAAHHFPDFCRTVSTSMYFQGCSQYACFR